MSVPTDEEIDAEIWDFLQAYTVTALKVSVITVVWIASLALCGFGWVSMFYGCLAGLMACFGTWRVYMKPATLLVFIAALAYAVMLR